MGFDLGGALSGVVSGVGNSISNVGNALAKGDIGGALRGSASLVGDAFGMPGLNVQASLLTGDFGHIGDAAQKDIANFQKASAVAQGVTSGNPVATFNAATSFGKVQQPGLNPPPGASYVAQPDQRLVEAAALKKKIASAAEQAKANALTKQALAQAGHPVAILHLAHPDLGAALTAHLSPSWFSRLLPYVPAVVGAGLWPFFGPIPCAAGVSISAVWRLMKPPS